MMLLIKRVPAPVQPSLTYNSSQGSQRNWFTYYQLYAKIPECQSLRIHSVLDTKKTSNVEIMDSIICVTAVANILGSVPAGSRKLAIEFSRSWQEPLTTSQYEKAVVSDFFFVKIIV